MIRIAQIILFIAIFGTSEGIAVGISRFGVNRKAKVVVLVVAQVSSVIFYSLIFKELRLYMHTYKIFISWT